MKQSATSEIARVSHLIKELYDGDPWHGYSIKELVTGITPEQAEAKPITGRHSIWEIILHMISWREIIVERLKLGEGFEVVKEKEWPPVYRVTPEVWDQTLKALEQSQQKLLKAMGDKSIPSQIQLYGIYAVFQHDLYHTGQLAVLKKLVTQPVKA
ncbi:MAG: DinB family protein [candidate division Zixibacteria bacterium]|nr:DinB family protein [candidate division Zixibacteria bacterium]